MSILISSGFDYCGSLTDLSINGLSAQIIAGTHTSTEDLARCGGGQFATGRFDGRAVSRSIPSSALGAFIGFLNSTTVMVCFAFNCSAIRPGDTLLTLSEAVWDGLRNPISLQWSSDNTLDVYTEDGLLIAGTQSLNPNIWYWINWSLTIDPIDAGESKIYIEGILDSLTDGISTDPHNSSGGFCNRLDFGKSTHNNSPSPQDIWLYDDLIVMDTLGGSFNSIPIQNTHIWTRFTIADEPGNTWTPNTGVTHYTQIDDNPTDNTNFIKTGTINNSDNWIVAPGDHLYDLSPSYPTMVVQTSYRSERDSFGNRNFQVIMNGVLGNQFEVDDVLLRYPSFYETNPATGLPWNHIIGDPVIPGIKLVS